MGCSPRSVARCVRAGRLRVYACYLLTPIAADLHISEGQSGQANFISGVFALLTSLFISALAGSLDRKRLLLSLTVRIIVSGTVVAVAPIATVPAVLTARSKHLVLVTLVTSCGLITEIAFRGYALTRLRELVAGRVWIAVSIQIVLTTALFVVSRGWGHGIVWLVDDVVFSAFFLWRRDLWACVVAHVVPNFLAATLFAIGVAT